MKEPVLAISVEVFSDGTQNYTKIQVVDKKPRFVHFALAAFELDRISMQLKDAEMPDTLEIREDDS